MPINYTKIKEGDTLDAASLNDRFEEIAGIGPHAGVNNLGQEDLERFALRRDHVPSIIETAVFPNGMCKIGPAASTVETYSSSLNAGVVGVPAAWLTTFGTLGANAPYGPPGGADTGWRIPATGGTPANAAEIEVNLVKSGTLIGNYKGILVRISISLNSCARPSTTIPLYNQNVPSVVIGIGWEDQGGVRRVFDRSVRWAHVCSRIKGSLDTFTLIQADDIPNNGDTVAKVFAVIAGANKAFANPDTPSPMIDFYNIEAIPLRFGDM